MTAVKPGKKPKSRRKDVDPVVIERERQIWAYHKAGLSMREIGQKIGVSRQRIHVLIKERRAELIAETCQDAIDVRAMITARLDALLAACYGKAIGGDLRAIDAVLRIEGKRAQLWGADVLRDPTVEVSQESNGDSDGKPAIVVKFRMGGQGK